MDRTKNRHGCLTAWLVFMIVVNGIGVVLTPLSASSIEQVLPGFRVELLWVLGFLTLLNIVFVIALFQWKKWGFIGFVINSLIALAINLYGGLGIGQSLMGLIGVVILYGVLHIGGERKGWAQLD